MGRSFFSGKYLVITLALLILLSRLLGAWDWKQRDHACLGDDKFHFQKKVQVFQWGSLRLYTWPVDHDCPDFEQVPNK